MGICRYGLLWVGGGAARGGAFFSPKLFPRGRAKSSHREAVKSFKVRTSHRSSFGHLLGRYKGSSLFFGTVPVYPAFPLSYLPCHLESMLHLAIQVLLRSLPCQPTSHPMPLPSLTLRPLKPGSIPPLYHTIIMNLQSMATHQTT